MDVNYDINDQDYKWKMVYQVELYAYLFGLTVFSGLIIYTLTSSRLCFLVCLELLGWFYFVLMTI
jgi:hypothetical protein